ncbi:unnamed protein product, partial [Staurois parvus]
MLQSPPYHVIQVFQSPPVMWFRCSNPLQSCDSGVPIPSISCDSDVPIPSSHVIQVFPIPSKSIAKDLQTWCGLQMSPTTVRRELHGTSFHG